MRKTLLTKLMLLTVAILGGVGSAWADDVSIATGTFNGKNESYTEGWSTTGTGKNRNDCIIIGSGENITSPTLDLSGYSKVTISIKARRFGTLTGSKATIDASIGGSSVGTTDATGTSATTSLTDISFEPTSSMTNVQLVFTCTNATSAGSSHGAGINTITITGTPSSSSSLTESDFALTDAPVALTFDLYNNATAQTISYYTSSSGEITVDGQGYVSASVDEENQTITVTPMAKTNGEVEITVSQAADEDYKAGSATFKVTITDSTPKTGGWMLTDLADLEEGDIFVIVGNNGSTYAMSNNNGTGSAPSAVSVTIENDEITSDVADNIKWNISGDATGGYTFYPNESTTTWLYCTNTNNGVRVGANDAKTFTISTDGYLVHRGTYRYVGIYNSSDWRCYESINANIKNQTFAFYKYVDGSAADAPRISADAVEVAYDATNGSIVFTLTNAVEGGVMTASTTAEWLTLGTVGETVPFTCEANDAATERTATVTLTYTYGDNETVTKSVTVTQTGNPDVALTIAEARAQATGDVVTKGVVTSCSGTTAYIQDATAAICVYGESLTVGDEVKVSGTLSTYKGLLEITSPSVEVLTLNNTVEPEVMTIAEINASDKQGWLVKIEEATVSAINSQNVTLAQDENTVVVRFNQSDDITFAVNDIVTLTANIGYYNTVQMANPTDVTVKENTAGVITITGETSINVDAAGVEDGNIAFTLTNVDAELIELLFVASDGTTEAIYDWLTADFNTEKNAIEYIVDANDGEARTAYMKIYAIDNDGNDVYSDLITITQAKYVAPDVEVDPAVAGVGAFVKVTSTADITAGNYLIVYEGNDTHDAVAFNGSLTTLDAANNGIKVDIADGKIPATDATVAATFTLQASGSLKSASGLYIGKEAYSNGLDAEESALANTFEIEDDGNAVITAEGGCTLRYNYASDNLRFRYYKSGQQAIALYKYDETVTPTITAKVTAAGYATFCSEYNLDFTEVEGLTAYKATVSGNEVSFTKVEGVPAREGVLLKGAEGTYTIPVIASADALEDNALIGVTTDTEVSETGIFVLMNGNEGVGFYKTRNAFTVGAHTAYLPSQASSRSFIGFNFDTTTGINTMQNAQNMMQNNEVYNLNGQRVAAPQRGLYIVNGRKVVVK